MTIELDFGQPQISAEQEYWRGQAIKLAESEKMDIAVIRENGNYQCWPVSKAGQGIFVAKYSVSAMDGVIDGDGGSDNVD